MFRLTDYQDVTAQTLDELHTIARTVAIETRQADGQAWTTMHFQQIDERGFIQGEGSFNVEPNTPMRVVWYWRNT